MVTEHPSSGRAASRSLNCDLNLVPFIDLLSTLVLFLLVTAVWLQISVIPASTSAPESSRTPAAMPPPPENILRVHLTPGRVDLLWPASQGNINESFEREAAQYPWAAIQASLQKGAATLERAQLSSEDSVPYGAVIQALDRIKESGIAKVALKTE